MPKKYARMVNKKRKNERRIKTQVALLRNFQNLLRENSDMIFG